LRPAEWSFRGRASAPQLSIGGVGSFLAGVHVGAHNSTIVRSITIDLRAANAGGWCGFACEFGIRGGRMALQKVTEGVLRGKDRVALSAIGRVKDIFAVAGEHVIEMRLDGFR